jgi:hypothetical protein
VLESKTFPIDDEGVHTSSSRSTSRPGQLMAGFEVSINGRFWVSTEEAELVSIQFAAQSPGQRRVTRTVALWCPR